MLRKIIVFISIVLFTLPLYAEPIGSIVLLRGNAILIDDQGQELSKLKKDDPLSTADTVSVLEKSILKIKLKDGSSLMLPANTVMKLDKYVFNDERRNSTVSLIKGKIRAEIKKFKGQEEYNEKNTFIINTSMAAIGVRGTEFLVNAYTVAEKPVTDTVLLSGKVNANVVGSTAADLIPGQAINSTEFVASGKIRTLSSESVAKLVANKQAFLPNVQLPDGSFIDIDSEIKNLKTDATNTSEVKDAKDASEAAKEAPKEAPTNNTNAPTEEAAKQSASNTSSAANSATSTTTTSASTAATTTAVTPSATAAPSVSVTPSAITAPAAPVPSAPIIPVTPSGAASAATTAVDIGAKVQAIKYFSETAWDLKDALDNRMKKKIQNECYYWVYEQQGDDPVFERIREEKDCDEFEFNFED